ncbi:MAG: Wzz/FepE/Etk N-terminal domain-containing protein, partial [Brooklawnia sp.]
MTSVQVLGLLRKNWLLILALAVAGVVAGAVVSWLQPTLYSATSTGYVVAGNSSTVGDAFAGQNLATDKADTYLPLVQSRSVAERVAKDLALDSIDPVVGALEGSTEGVIFHIKATASSPQFAAQLADAAIRATAIEANALETLTVTGENTGYTVVTIVPVELAQTP